MTERYFESCVWRTVSSQSFHHPQEVLLAQFSLYVHKGGLKPDSFYFYDNLKNLPCILFKFFMHVTNNQFLDKLNSRSKKIKMVDLLRFFAFYVKCAKELAPPFTKLLNISLQAGVFPNFWEMANICPIFRKGNRTNCEKN